MKKLKKYTGIGLGIIAAPVVIYGVYKTNVAPELINNKNNSLFLSNPKQGLSFPRSSAKHNAKKSTNLDLDITLKSAGNIENKFQTMIGTSNITDGWFANIFEDSSGNLWSMGDKTPLQVLRKGKNIWEEAGHKSNITDGWRGTIFEDSSGNLWSMGKGTPLQVLRKGEKDWELAGHNSNITGGTEGTIFEDSSGNLWSMGNNGPLQVLEKNETEWKSSLGSNIKDGSHGTIYEDSKGTLWSMANGTALQFLMKDTNTWVSAGNGSNITDGRYGDFFEDSSGNLWSMGNRTPLQVLRNGENTWEPAGHNSNITNGNSGSIFEDSTGNLWGMGTGKPLQVLKKGKKNWENSKGSNIKDGGEGTIFEDSSGNLWSMGYGTPLQVLKKGSSSWREAQGSNVKNGSFGKLFEDSKGNLWSATKERPLQVKPFGFKKWINYWKPSILNHKEGGVSEIFEDQSGNIWSKGLNGESQVLEKYATKWKNADSSKAVKRKSVGHGFRTSPPISSPLLDINHLQQTELEDSSGNKWRMNVIMTDQEIMELLDKKQEEDERDFNLKWSVEFWEDQYDLMKDDNKGTLEVLRKGESNWKDAKHNSNIKDGRDGYIYEDSQGNLWSMGKGTPLQTLPKGGDNWVPMANSNIVDGEGGIFFEDSRGNLWSKGKGTPLQVYANTKVQNKNNFKITNKSNGAIFEDSKGNLWSMGDGTPLQVLRNEKDIWELAAHNSIITHGYGGTIFEDSQKNLWSMASGTPLQVLRKGNNNWELAAQNSNIKNGALGTIFEDSKGNLWSMAFETPLQVLRKGKNAWEEAENGSNITGGSLGTIFEDSFGNLWSMGNRTPLQVLRKNGTGNWEEAGHNSNITDGYGGTIFEDSSGNLWSMGDKTPLQVLRNGENTWEPAAHGSNITWGTQGTIFEDSFGNLWSMGFQTPLQVLRNGKDTWKPAAQNSNITDGQGGTIYEDSQGNLWSMGNKTPLQVLRKNGTQWEEAAHILIANKSNITDGSWGAIYEDSSGNLWSMGDKTPLQAFNMNKLGNAKFSNKYNLSLKDNRFNLEGDLSDIKRKYFKLKYKLSTDKVWKDFDAKGISKDVITTGEYQFEWVINSSLELAPSSNAMPNIPNQIVIDAEDITGIPSENKGITSYIGANDGKITLPTTGLPTGVTIQVSKGGVEVTDLNSLAPGTYSFKYILGENFLTLGTLHKLNSVFIAESALTGIDPTQITGKPISSKTTTSYIGANDGKITLPTTGLPTGVTIQVSKDGVEVTDLDNLKPGTYHFQYVLDTSKYVLKSGTLPNLNSVDITESDITQIDGATVTVKPTIDKDTTSFKGNNDGSITTPTLPEGVKLVVTKNGNAFNKTDFTHLKAGVYVFKYELKDKYIWKNGSKPSDVSLEIKESDITQIDGATVTVKPTIDKDTTSFKGNNDGSITTPTLPEGVKLVVTKDGNAFNKTDFTHLKAGVYVFKYELKDKYIWKNGSKPSDVSLEIKESDITQIDGTTVTVKPTIDKDTTSFKGNNDGSITTPTLPEGVKLVVTKNGNAFNKTDFTHLKAGVYVFKYELKDKYIWKNGSKPSDVSLEIKESDITQIDGTTVTVKPTIDKDTTSFKGNNDGSITTPTLPEGVKLVVTKNGNAFNKTDFTHLKAGVYVFKYELKDKYIWKNGSKPSDVSLEIKESDITQIDGATVTVKPTIDKDTTSFKGNNDGSITMPTLSEGVKLVVTKDGNAFNKTDFTHLKAGVYVFKYELKDKYIWKNGSKPSDVSLEIKESDITQIDGTTVTVKPTIDKDTTSFKGNNDGSITTPTLPEGVKLVVTKNGNAFNKTDFTHLKAGVYVFKYELKDKYIWKNGSKPSDVSLEIKESDITQIDGATVTVKPTIDKDTTSFKGNNDGSITTPTLPEGVKLVVTKNGNAFNKTDFTHLKAGVYVFKYELKDKYIWKNGSKPSDVSLEIKESDITQIDGTTVTVKPTIDKDTTSFKGNNDGSITMPTLSEGVKLVVTKDGNAFNETNFTHLKAGVYVFKYELKDKYIWKNGSKPSDVSLEIKESDITQIDGTTVTVKPTIDKDTTSFKGNNDGSITTPTLPEGVKLVVTKNGNAFNKTDFTHLKAGVYVFKYELKDKYIWKNGSKPSDVSLEIKESDITQIDGTTVTVKPTIDKDTTSFKGNNDGSITTPTLPEGVKLVVTKNGNAFNKTDFTHLKAGVYVFKYELKDKYIWKNGSKPSDVSLEIKESDITQIDGTTVTVKPTIDKDTTSFKGNNDGSITTPTLPEGVKLVVTKNGNAFNKTDFTHLKAGVYVFKYELKDKYIWKNGSKPSDVKLTIKDSTIIQVDGSTVTVKPSLTKDTTSYIGAKDGEIDVPVLPNGFEFVVTKDGNAFNGTDFNNLEPGVYKFTYQLKSGFVLKTSTDLPTEVSLTISESTLIGIDSTQIIGKPIVTKTTTSYIGANDGKITLPTTGLPTGVTIQVSKGGVKVTDIKHLSPGTYDMKYVLDTSKCVLKSGTLPILTSVVITESDITQIDGAIVTVKPTIDKDTTSFKGNNDGSITMPTLPEGVKLVVFKDGKLLKKSDFSKLSAGKYVFKYELKDKYIWKNQSKPSDVSLEIINPKNKKSSNLKLIIYIISAISGVSLLSAFGYKVIKKIKSKK